MGIEVLDLMCHATERGAQISAARNTWIGGKWVAAQSGKTFVTRNVNEAQLKRVCGYIEAGQAGGATGP